LTTMTLCAQGADIFKNYYPNSNLVFIHGSTYIDSVFWFIPCGPLLLTDTSKMVGVQILKSIIFTTL